MNLEFRRIDSGETELIKQVSMWYYQEWSIPKLKTLESLGPSTDQNVIFQIIVTSQGVPIGTGGLYRRVGIQDRLKKFEIYSPWVALMYTTPEVRGKGLGERLLDEIELHARSKGHIQIYLFTHSAESLYKRKGWHEIDRYEIEEKSIVVMTKRLESN